MTCTACGSHACYPIANNTYYELPWYTRLFWYVVGYLKLMPVPHFWQFSLRCYDCGNQSDWYDTKEAALTAWD